MYYSVNREDLEKGEDMKKQGFATSGILYTVLLLFVALLFGVLQNLQNKKTILDQLKIETISALNCDCAYLREEIDTLKDYLRQTLLWKMETL